MQHPVCDILVKMTYSKMQSATFERFKVSRKLLKSPAAPRNSLKLSGTARIDLKRQAKNVFLMKIKRSSNEAEGNLRRDAPIV